MIKINAYYYIDSSYYIAKLYIFNIIVNREILLRLLLRLNISLY